jgi:ribosome-associated protein
MAKIDVTKEISFTTSRSGGSGGQNVNKVETAVEGRWNIIESSFFTNQEKEIIVNKLASRVVSQSILSVRSQAARTQLANKQLVVKKINELIHKSLIVDIKRVATKVPKSVIEKRKDLKTKNSEKKQNRKKINYE